MLLDNWQNDGTPHRHLRRLSHRSSTSKHKSLTSNTTVIDMIATQKAFVCAVKSDSHYTGSLILLEVSQEDKCKRHV